MGKKSGSGSGMNNPDPDPEPKARKLIKINKKPDFLPFEMAFVPTGT
jgi:hypothetical protein